MKMQLHLLAAGVLLFPSFGYSQSTGADRQARLQEAYERLDTYIARQMRANHMPGLSLSLTDREGLLRTSQYGYADVKLKTPVTPETEFEIGSISKSFTSICLLQLMEQGRWDPQQPVTKYLPWFSIHTRYRPLTSHDLLTHSAGLPRDRDDVPSSPYQAAGVRDRWTGYAPGEQFVYSNIDYQIMGYLLGEITGETSGDNVQQRLLTPLGMTHSEPVITHDTYERLATGYSFLYDDRPNSPSAPQIEATWLQYGAGDGAIASTASDLAAYLRMLLKRGATSNGRIMSEESFALLTQKAADEGGGRWYGYGMNTWSEDGHDYIGHTGGMVGYTSRLEGDMDAGLGVIALTNYGGGDVGISRYALKLLRAVYEGRDLPPVPEAASPTQVENASDYAGTYVTPDGKRFTIRADGESLVLEQDGTEATLEKYGRDAFLVPLPAFSLFPLKFHREDTTVVEVFHGGDWYMGERYSGPKTFPVPAAWQAYPGHYRVPDAWFSNFRIVVRKGKLLLISPDGGELVMVPAEEGGFWAGREGDLPQEQVKCDTAVHGKTLRCDLSGVGYYRVFTP